MTVRVSHVAIIVASNIQCDDERFMDPNSEVIHLLETQVDKGHK